MHVFNARMHEKRLLLIWGACPQTPLLMGPYRLWHSKNKWNPSSLNPAFATVWWNARDNNYVSSKYIMSYRPPGTYTRSL